MGGESQRRARAGFVQGLHLAVLGVLFSEFDGTLPREGFEAIWAGLDRGSLVARVSTTVTAGKLETEIELVQSDGTSLARFSIDQAAVDEIRIQDSDLPPETPVARLGHLYHELNAPAGAVLNPIAREFLARSIEASVRRAEPLHAVMGLSGPGRYGSLQDRLLLAKRNHHLLAALDAISLDSEAAYTRCKRLSKQIERFVRHEWSQARRRLDPDESWPTWKREVFRAAQTGLQVDLSPTALHDIVRAKGACSPDAAWLKVLSDLLI